MTFDYLDDIIDSIEQDPRASNYELKWSSMEQYVRSVKNDARENSIEFTREKGDFWAYNY